jgi:hypothetical protein
MHLLADWDRYDSCYCNPVDNWDATSSSVQITVECWVFRMSWVRISASETTNRSCLWCYALKSMYHNKIKNKQNKLHGLSPRSNYTDRSTAACRRSDCQLLRIEGATLSAWRIPTAVFSAFKKKWNWNFGLFRNLKKCIFTGKYRKDISICIHATLIRSFITLAYSS